MSVTSLAQWFTQLVLKKVFAATKVSEDEGPHDQHHQPHIPPYADPTQIDGWQDLGPTQFSQPVILSSRCTNLKREDMTS